MHVGADYHGVAGNHTTSKENLEYILRFGVRHLMPQVRKKSEEGAWDLDELKMMKDNCDQYGVDFEGIRMGSRFGSSTDYLRLEKNPERDRAIEIINGNIQKASQVGVKVISYHWGILPILQRYLPPGRGGSSCKRWTLEENWKDLPVFDTGRVPIEVMWERITYFLERVIPVAEEYKVRMACHPPDPPTPPGYRGIDRWDNPMFEGLKRFVETVESPYNGFQLCLGTVMEGLVDPGKEIFDIIRYFGEREKLFSIHFRNIRGGRYNFVETYPDEGDVDMYKVMQVLRDVQYPYSILPDHTPTHPDEPGRLQSFAFCYGYIKALIQAVNSEA